MQWCESCMSHLDVTLATTLSTEDGVRLQVLLDWELDDMTGFDVVKRLRATAPWMDNAQIILLSGHTPDEVTVEALSSVGCASPSTPAFLACCTHVLRYARLSCSQHPRLLGKTRHSG